MINEREKEASICTACNLETNSDTFTIPSLCFFLSWAHREVWFLYVPFLAVYQLKTTKKEKGKRE
jgi:hypothetical protein